MTDKEAILSVIDTQFKYCADVYEDYEKRMKSIKELGIYACTFCEFNRSDKKSEHPCWQHRMTDWLMKVIPQLDISKGETK